MNKIFIYELKRLILHKFFLMFAALAGIYGYMILSGDIITGIAYTAPFSPWSYGMYLAKVLPLLMVCVLFFITFLYSRQEQAVKQLTFAAPVNPIRYCLIKCAAMAAGYCVIVLLIMLISILFYARVFGFYNFGTLVLPITVTLFPAFFLVFGIGVLAGSIHPALLYILMVVVLALGFFPLPAFFDIYGGHLFDAYPLTLPAGPDGEPAFSLPPAFIMGKLFFAAAGLVMAGLGIRRYGKL